jgi:hypothetical protein
MANVDYWPKQQGPPKVTEVQPKVTQPIPPKQPPKKGRP